MRRARAGRLATRDRLRRHAFRPPDASPSRSTSHARTPASVRISAPPGLREGKAKNAKKTKRKNQRVAQAKIRTKFGSFRGMRRAELAQIVTVLAEMPIRRSFFSSSSEHQERNPVFPTFFPRFFPGFFHVFSHLSDIDIFRKSCLNMLCLLEKSQYCDCLAVEPTGSGFRSARSVLFSHQIIASASVPVIQKSSACQPKDQHLERTRIRMRQIRARERRAANPRGLGVRRWLRTDSNARPRCSGRCAAPM